MRQIAQQMKQRVKAPQLPLDDSEAEEEAELQIDSELEEFDI